MPELASRVVWYYKWCMCGTSIRKNARDSKAKVRLVKEGKQGRERGHGCCFILSERCRKLEPSNLRFLGALARLPRTIMRRDMLHRSIASVFRIRMIRNSLSIGSHIWLFGGPAVGMAMELQDLMMACRFQPPSATDASLMVQLKIVSSSRHAPGCRMLRWPIGWNPRL